MEKALRKPTINKSGRQKKILFLVLFNYCDKKEVRIKVLFGERSERNYDSKCVQSILSPQIIYKKGLKLINNTKEEICDYVKLCENCERKEI